MQYLAPILPFLLAGVGLWLMLPRGAARGRRLGILLGLVALGLIAWRVPPLLGWLEEGVFGVMALTTIVSAAAAISARNPLYSAIWFGLTLLGTAGLFLLIGAQFLSVATITVYAGAILVTFLFVIMLAQPEGHAYYDRLSWEALLSAATGAVLVGMLTSVIGHAFDSQSRNAVRSVAVAMGETVGSPLEITDDARASGVLAQEHVATFGRELVGKHLISMQAAGALMLAALVGAVAIVTHGRQSESKPQRYRDTEEMG